MTQSYEYQIKNYTGEWEGREMDFALKQLQCGLIIMPP